MVITDAVANRKRQSCSPGGDDEALEDNRRDV